MNEAVLHLMTALADEQEGYREGCELAESLHIVALFGSLFGMHQIHADELSSAVSKLHPARRAARPGTTPAAVLAMRATSTGLESNMVDAVLARERRLLSLYSDAVAASAGDPTLGRLLVRQSHTLSAWVADLPFARGTGRTGMGARL